MKIMRAEISDSFYSDLLALHELNSQAGGPVKIEEQDIDEKKQDIEHEQNRAKHHLREDSKYQRHSEGFGLAAIFGSSYMCDRTHQAHRYDQLHRIVFRPDLGRSRGLEVLS